MNPKLLIILLLLLAVGACSRHSQVSDTLTRAEEVMEEHPDSALAMLEAIHDSAITGSRDRALYALLMSQALHKNFIDVDSDSLVSVAVDYFRDHGDRYEMLSSYYLSEIAYNAKDYSKGTNAVLRAKELAEELHDTLFIARTNEMMADMYFENYDFDNEIKHRKIAIKAYHDLNRTLNEAYSSIDLSTAYAQSGNPDSALKVLHDIAPIVDKSDEHLYKSFLQNHIDPYTLIEEYDSAKNVADRLLNMFGEDGYNHIDYSEISEAYLKCNDLSKAQYFIDKAIEQNPDAKSSISVLSRLLQICNYKNDTQSTASILDSILQAQNRYLKAILNKHISNAEKGYYKVKSIEADQEKMLLRRNLAILLLITVIIIIVALFIYRNQKIKNKNLKLAAENNLYRLNELEIKFKEMETLYKESPDKYEAMRKTLDELFKQRFEMLDSLSRYYGSGSKQEGSDAIVVYRMVNSAIEKLRDKDYLIELEKSVDRYKDGIMERLRSICPRMSALYYQLALYMFLGLSPGTISRLLKMTKSTYYVNRSRIKAQILNSGKEIPEDIMEYFS